MTTRTDSLDTFYYYDNVQDTAATTSCTLFLRDIPSGTDTKLPCWEPSNYHRPKTHKSSKWIDKKLKKTGRATKSTLGSRSGEQYTPLHWDK